MHIDPVSWLERATIDPAVRALRPDYRVLLLVADGLRPGPGDQHSEQLLKSAESAAQGWLKDPADVPAHPHVADWYDAFRAFGAKPQRTRPSVAALLRRVPTGLPRVDRLTDSYNAISVTHVVPVGGEDLDHYAGPLRLTRAAGDETFETTANGAPTIEHPEPGEVVWRDDAGITCRRWNWRQCTRTHLGHATERAVFILDALRAMDDAALRAAGAALTAALTAASPGVKIISRTLGE